MLHGVCVYAVAWALFLWTESGGTISVFIVIIPVKCALNERVSVISK